VSTKHLSFMQFGPRSRRGPAQIKALSEPG
jgi:hypothetical protein